MTRVYLLGASSFLGKNISEKLKENFDLISLSRPEFDLLDTSTFSKNYFSNSIIVDCINVNNGNTNDITKCNIEGFKTLLEFLKKECINVKYLYFSTISTISEDICKINAYVNSKKIAEEYLINSGILHHIVRLSFPIGKGENSTRLTTRLIQSIRNNKELTISDINLNITPVRCIANEIKVLLNFNENKISFLSNNQYTPLVKFVEDLGELLHTKPVYKINKAASHFEPKTETPLICDVDYKEILKEMI